MTTIDAELSRILKIQFLETLLPSELAFWLIASFTPDRYRAGDRDVIHYACGLMYNNGNSNELISMFVTKLWAQFKIEPDELPCFDAYGKLIGFRKNVT
jgi:hypothetical protein